MKKSKIFISTSNYKSKYGNNLNEILCNTDIYKNIEVASGHITNASSLEIIENRLREGSCILIHNYAFREPNNLMLNLCEMDEKKSNQILEYILKMIDIIKDLGGDYYSLHGGFYPSEISADEQKVYKEKFYFTLEKILKYADSKGIIIGVENHVVEERNVGRLFLYNIEEFNELFSRLPYKNLCLHLDVGHLKVSSKTYGFSVDEFIGSFIDKIVAIHLHDNDGLTDSHGKFESDAYFMKSLKDMSLLKYIIIESWDQDDSSISDMERSLENA